MKQLMLTFFLSFVVSMASAADNGVVSPLKAMAWEDAQGNVWLSYNSPAYIKERHKLPDELMKPISGIGGLIDMALQ